MSIQVAKGKLTACDDEGNPTVIFDILEGDMLEHGKYYVHTMGEGHYFDDLEPAVKAFVTLHEFVIAEYSEVSK